MNLGDLRKNLDDATQSASEIVRYLSLAGVATIWLLRAPTAAGSTIPVELLLPLLLFVGALVIDLGQYVYTATSQLILIRGAEKERAEGEEFRIMPGNIVVPFVLFYSKIATAGIAYALLALVILASIQSGSLPSA